jgi:hypothetical protein
LPNLYNGFLSRVNAAVLNPVGDELCQLARDKPPYAVRKRAKRFGNREAFSYADTKSEVGGQKGLFLGGARINRRVIRVARGRNGAHNARSQVARGRRTSTGP